MDTKLIWKKGQTFKFGSRDTIWQSWVKISTFDLMFQVCPGEEPNTFEINVFDDKRNKMIHMATKESVEKAKVYCENYLTNLLEKKH